MPPSRSSPQTQISTIQPLASYYNLCYNLAMPSKSDPREGYRQIQARAEASNVAISHSLTEALHLAINALAAMSNMAKNNFLANADPAPAPQPKPPTKKRPGA